MFLLLNLLLRVSRSRQHAATALLAASGLPKKRLPKSPMLNGHLTYAHASATTKLIEILSSTIITSLSTSTLYQSGSPVHPCKTSIGLTLKPLQLLVNRPRQSQSEFRTATSSRHNGASRLMEAPELLRRATSSVINWNGSSNPNQQCHGILPFDAARSNQGNLVDAEANAVAYCTNPVNDTRPMPDGFIKTAHFRHTDKYVQISGTYDPSKMNLSPNDCGGEYDNHGAMGRVGNPVGAAVDGAHDFMQFMGGCDIPGNAVFCLRAYYDIPGFSNCNANYDLPVGYYPPPGPHPFRQGDPTTPAAVAAPASSQCASVPSPVPQGVTYYWAGGAPAATATATPNGSSGNSGNKNTTVNGAKTAAASPRRTLSNPNLSFSCSYYHRTLRWLATCSSHLKSFFHPPSPRWDPGFGTGHQPHPEAQTPDPFGMP
ncbi:hypothetical protein PCASD_01073 [Puccinia coronata f. sp. avenae]|uniref:Uncharacterized protein n=1 Tax=Puccinia coronata f. sp. avenae TaxID=200324 RepID=A0A2N5VMP4_9BASI|nr:hypothetical protein PCASD_01073 [Puccinia coronata f. sp. avenae]